MKIKSKAPSTMPRMFQARGKEKALVFSSFKGTNSIIGDPPS